MFVNSFEFTTEERSSVIILLIILLLLHSAFVYSPWCNCTGWLGVKHQVTYLFTVCCALYWPLFRPSGCWQVDIGSFDICINLQCLLCMQRHVRWERERRLMWVCIQLLMLLVSYLKVYLVIILRITLFSSSFFKGCWAAPCCCWKHTPCSRVSWPLTPSSPWPTSLTCLSKHGRSRRRGGGRRRKKRRHCITLRTGRMETGGRRKRRMRMPSGKHFPPSKMWENLLPLFCYVCSVVVLLIFLYMYRSWNIVCVANQGYLVKIVVLFEGIL